MRRILPILIVVAGMLVRPAAAVAATSPLPADGYVGVAGHGYGHAHGLGQWGAKGLADQGKSWTEILSHYYTNAPIGTRPAETIRVLVEDSADSLVTSQSHPFSVWWSGGAKVADSSSSFPFLRVAVSGSGVAIQKASSLSGPWTTLSTGTGRAEFHPGSQALGLVSSSGSVRYYRGQIEALRPSGTSSILSINDLSIDAYLYGVVPREVPASWDADALRAQAVAARSYAANKKDAARAASKLYDICATTSCQVYGGYASGSSPSEAPKVLESATTNDAVNTTSGKVLTSGGKPIFAEYSSSTGGYSAQGSAPYLAPVPDPTDDVSPYHSWSTRVSVPAIQNAWPSIGSLIDARVTKRNGYGDYGGRVTEMVLEGTSGSVTISGGTFRSKMGLRSDWFALRTYRAQLVSMSSDVSGPAGADIPVSVTLKNAGSADWQVGGSTLLATTPAGRVSAFDGSEWVSSSKPARITKNLSRPSATTVGPGETGEARFVMHTAGIAPGVYVERLRPLQDGVTWMNDPGIAITVHVLSSWREDAGNLLTNAGFESGWSAWQGAGVNGSDGPATGAAREGSRSMHLSAGGQKSFRQALALAGGTGRRFVLSGWATTSGTRSNGGVIELTLALHNTDGSTSWNPVLFSRSPHDWQYVERSVVASKPFAGADLWATFYDQSGNVYFDALRLLDTSLSNPSFDVGTIGWSGAGLGSGDGPSANVFRDGFRSMHFAGGTKSLRQRIPIRGPAGRYYAAAVWTKADRASASGMTALSIVFNNLDGSQSRTTIQAEPGDHDWTYLPAHVAAVKSFSSLDVIVSVSSQTGSIFFDGLALRENRIPNGSFEDGLAPWTGYGSFAGSDGVTDALSRDVTRSLAFSGGPLKSGAVVHLNSGGSGGGVLAGAWNRTDGGGGKVWLSVAFRNRDGTSTFREIVFPAQAHDWTRREMLVTAAKPYGSIDVMALQENAGGRVAFDGVALWAPA